MFNPLFLFTMDVLYALVKRGELYFVRNQYPNAFDHLQTDIKAAFVFSGYVDLPHAKAHYNATRLDSYGKLYDWNKPEDQEKLKLAAGQPVGYKIYSTFFLPGYKNKITPQLKDKINRYKYRHTTWKPGKGDTVSFDLYIEFGALFATMGFEGHQLSVKLDDIENQR